VFSTELVAKDHVNVEARLQGCEHYHRNDADLPFDWILAELLNGVARLSS
jgi:hypothetical protein